VDGAEIATRSAPGSLLTGTGPLRIGGNNLRGEFFGGRIDEVRVYDRALSAAQIVADMGSPVSAP
jgi:concanavalin A-like lectin/glucanase superfamily protein